MDEDIDRYLRLREKISDKEGRVSAIRYPYAELLEKERKDGGQPLIIQKSLGSSNRDTDSPYGEFAIVERARVNKKGEDDGTDLEIQSETMQKALSSIIGKHSQVGTRADPIIFKKPYYSLFHCRHELRRREQQESNTAEQRKHLQWLIEFISRDLKALEKVQEGLVDKGLIDFKHLPIIFEAGCVVVGQLNGDGINIREMEKPHKTRQPECFLFHRIGEVTENKKDGGKYIEIEVLRWGFNGSSFGLTKARIFIKEFAGARKITDLVCYPLIYKEESEKNVLVPQLVKRGKKWCQYVESRNFHYDGIAVCPKESQWHWEISMVPKMMTGRVVLDYPSFAQAFPQLATVLHSSGASDDDEDDTNRGTINEFFKPSDVWEFTSKVSISRIGLWNCYSKDTKELYEPSEAHALLCPAAAVGYHLHLKSWGYFDVDLLDEMKWYENPIQRLEIPDLHKQMLLDLVAEHGLPSSASDTVLSKGEGMVFLLHGPPGCGKTLTAELIAEHERKPLVRIIASDLGQHPSDVESALRALLKLALRSQAIVLIDEADTFLAKRSRGGNIGDYFHNSIVAIFLKHLEYFPGIIFLTTNQYSDLDPAVISRVIKLRYGELEAPGRAKIWKTHLSRSEQPLSEEELQPICRELSELYQLDGREIKTLSNLALTICRRRKQKVSLKVVKELYGLTHGTDAIGSCPKN